MAGEKASLASELSAGLTLGGGVDFYPGGPIANVEFFALELRFNPALLPASVDLMIDWEQLVFTWLLTSQPRLGLTALYHHPLSVAPRLDLVLAPGFDVEWGRDAVVINERLRWVPAGAFGTTARFGIDHPIGHGRSAVGVYLRGVLGFRTADDGPEAWRQVAMEVSWIRGKESDDE